MLEDSALQEREKLHRTEKLRIAAAVARMVEEAQVVILDSGTITAAIARVLRNLRNVTIITCNKYRCGTLSFQSGSDSDRR